MKNKNLLNFLILTCILTVIPTPLHAKNNPPASHKNHPPQKTAPQAKNQSPNPTWLNDQTRKAQQANITKMQGTIPAQWRIIWTQNPSQQATISWSTRKPGQKHIVYFDTVKQNQKIQKYKFATASYRDGQYTTTPAERRNNIPTAYYHHVKLTKLKPSTRYYFIIASDQNISREFYFITAPNDQRNIAIISSGDSRANTPTSNRAIHPMRCQMNLMLRYFIKTHKEILAFAHGGDYVFKGNKWGDWTHWLSHNELCVTKDGHILPIIPTRGNHDTGPLFNQIFDNPGGTQNYYLTKLSPLASLITLNSEISVSGKQYTWIKKTLHTQRKNTPWLIAQYHRPLYPAVKKPGRAKRFWTTLFENNNLNIALESDGHALKRTIPIRKDKYHPNGVVYLGEGGMGVKQRLPLHNRWYFKPNGIAISQHHLILLQFNPQKIRSRFYSPKLKVLDDYTITNTSQQ